MMAKSASFARRWRSVAAVSNRQIDDQIGRVARQTSSSSSSSSSDGATSTHTSYATAAASRVRVDGWR